MRDRSDRDQEAERRQNRKALNFLERITRTLRERERALKDELPPDGWMHPFSASPLTDDDTS